MELIAILKIASALVSVIGSATNEIAKLKVLAAGAGATDEQLADLDVRLTAAIAARQAEQL